MSEIQAAAAPVESAPVSTPADAAVEGTQEASPAPAPEKVQEPAKPSKKQYKAKINGKEQSFDLGDDEITQYIQKAASADAKFEEAAMTRKQVEAFIKDLKSNPLAVLSHPELGIDIKALAEKVLLNELAEAEKSPEQKKVEEMERKLREYEEKSQKLEEEKRASEMQRIKAEQFKKFDDDIVSALEGTTLPKSPYVVKRITDTLIEALSLVDENGKQMYPDVTVKDVMPYVEDLMRGEMEQMFQTMPSEMLEKLVGKSHLTNLRKNRIAQAKAKPTSLSEIKETTKVEDKKANENKKQQSFEDIFGRF
jgi:hypothetical protein